MQSSLPVVSQMAKGVSIVSETEDRADQKKEDQKDKAGPCNLSNNDSSDRTVSDHDSEIFVKAESQSNVE